jgi:hypothetical protein
MMRFSVFSGLQRARITGSKLCHCCLQPEVVQEPELLHEDFRSQFPMAFGTLRRTVLRFCGCAVLTVESFVCHRSARAAATQLGAIACQHCEAASCRGLVRDGGQPRRPRGPCRRNQLCTAGTQQLLQYSRRLRAGRPLSSAGVRRCTRSSPCVITDDSPWEAHDGMLDASWQVARSHHQLSCANVATSAQYPQQTDY